jgi:hypothetical protein
MAETANRLKRSDLLRIFYHDTVLGYFAKPLAIIAHLYEDRLTISYNLFYITGLHPTLLTEVKVD